MCRGLAPEPHTARLPAEVQSARADTKCMRGLLHRPARREFAEQLALRVCESEPQVLLHGCTDRT